MSGQASISSVQGVPMSQAKAQRSRTTGFTMTGTPSVRATGAAVCKARV